MVRDSAPGVAASLVSLRSAVRWLPGRRENVAALGREGQVDEVRRRSGERQDHALLIVVIASCVEGCLFIVETDGTRTILLIPVDSNSSPCGKRSRFDLSRCATLLADEETAQHD